MHRLNLGEKLIQKHPKELNASKLKKIKKKLINHLLVFYVHVVQQLVLVIGGTVINILDLQLYLLPIGGYKIVEMRLKRSA